MGVSVGSSGRGLPLMEHNDVHRPKTAAAMEHNHGSGLGLPVGIRHRRLITRTRHHENNARRTPGATAGKPGHAKSHFALWAATLVRLTRG
jgi:hypothetical protein